MKEKLLQFLACPDCAGEINLAEVTEKDKAEILEGTLKCASCEKTFPVLRGIPRFADLSEIEQEKAETAKNFGWEWTHFAHEDERYEQQFLDWLQPVDKKFFAGKMVLEGGCGKGRHTQLAARWGAKEIVGIDLSVAVETAFAKTRNLPNAHIVQADIFRLPFKKVFDYAYSIGVLHHTPDPKQAFVSLASKVKSGGHISAWIYGAENNEWITRFVNPIRERFTSKINPPALLQLSKLPTLGVFLATKLIYKPLNKNAKNLAKHLFYNDYLNYISRFGWVEQHSIVFDHLVAPTAFYISRDEFETWWKEIQAEDAKITWHNQNSWRGFGKITNQKDER